MTGTGLVVAAPRSGAGKTTLTLGLMRALARRGLKVAAAKCGPDYIDPAFHAVACDGESVNLDSWAMPPALLESLAASAARDADIVICEGLMGLFDGVPGEEGRTGSTADIAAACGWPVLLVLDVSGQSTTAAAVAKGLATYDPRITIGGVILNRVGSERHRRLVQAAETSGLEALIDAMADFVEAHVDLDSVVAMAGASAAPLPACGERSPVPRCGDGRVRGWVSGHELTWPLTPTLSPQAGRGGRDAIAIPPPGQRIALAHDEAFSFIYPHLLRGWREAGAEIVTFSPLADERPPAACDCCWLPGGYPELHAGRIATADRFLRGLDEFAESKPIHGECGGYMVLGRGLVDAAGVQHAMAGLLSVVTSFEKRKMQLGYRQARLLADGPLGPAGARLSGHEFHYSTILDPGSDEGFADVSGAHGDAPQPAGGRRGLVSGSFFHAIARVD